MTSPSSSITRSTLREAIELLFDGDAEMALLYFSGHGYIKSTGGYLVTTDASKYDEGVSMDDVLVLANQSKAKNKIVILDCCHSGALGSPSTTGSSLAQLSEGLSVLTASRDSESALEINGSGVFTSLVVDALKGGAADLRGNITPGSLYSDHKSGKRKVAELPVLRFIAWCSIFCPRGFTVSGITVCMQHANINA